MIKFSKEEINLCEQIAEKHRKEIKYGDWYISIDSRMYLWLSSSPFNKKFVDICEPQNQADKIIPLWTISDCLEFLREQKPQMEFELVFGDEWKIIFHWTKTYEGKTPLEACLKAVIEVLKNEKI